jgi:hypothetical protein
LTNSTPDPGRWSQSLPPCLPGIGRLLHARARPPVKSPNLDPPPVTTPALQVVPALLLLLLNDAKPQTSETRLALHTRLDNTSFCSVLAATEPVDLCFAPCLVSKPISSCHVVSLHRSYKSAPGTLRLGDARPACLIFFPLRPRFRSKTQQQQQQFSKQPC